MLIFFSPLRKIDTKLWFSFWRFIALFWFKCTVYFRAHKVLVCLHLYAHLMISVETPVYTTTTLSSKCTVKFPTWPFFHNDNPEIFEKGLFNNQVLKMCMQRWFTWLNWKAVNIYKWLNVILNYRKGCLINT